MIMNYISQIGTFMYTLDQRLWNGWVEANRYFSTLSVMLVTIMGAFAGNGRGIRHMVNDLTGFHIEGSLLAGIALTIVIYGINLAESIIASDAVDGKIQRPIIHAVVFAAAFFFGYHLDEAAKIAIIVVTACLALSELWNLVLTLTGKKANEEDIPESEGV